MRFFFFMTTLPYWFYSQPRFSYQQGYQQSYQQVNLLRIRQLTTFSDFLSTGYDLVIHNAEYGCRGYSGKKSKFLKRQVDKRQVNNKSRLVLV